MSAPQYATLGSLLGELSGRIGYGSQGASTGVLRTNLKSIIRNAQEVLYFSHEWARLRRYWTVSVGLDQYLIDYPDNCHPDRIRAISILRGNVWSPPLEKGIRPEMYTTQDNNAPPYRWEPYEQIELFPKSDDVYSLRVFGLKTLDAFEEDTDRATIDDRMIFTLALGDAKAHYRQPDAAIYVQRAEALTLKLKAKSWGQSRFLPKDYEEEPLPKPVVV